MPILAAPTKSNISQAIAKLPLSDIIKNPGIIATLDNQPFFITELSLYLDKMWERHKLAKTIYEQHMEEDRRAFDGRYDAQKLAEIESVGAVPIWMEITGTKCLSTIAWLQDLLFSQNDRCWGLNTTPYPEVDEETQNKIWNDLYQSMYNAMQSSLQLQGIPQDPIMMRQAIAQQMPEMFPVLKKEVLAKIEVETKDRIEMVSQMVDDKLVEGEWEAAMSDALFDFTVYGTCILKGPYYKLKKSYKRVNGVLTVVDDIIPWFSAVSPLNFYPAPEAEDIGGSDTVERITFTPAYLQSLGDLPGYRKEVITAILDEYRVGRLRDWNNQVATYIERPDDSNQHESDRIDALEIWCKIKGSMLLAWKAPEQNIDPDRYYDVAVWKVDRHIIKVMMNYDPLGDKLYHKANFVGVPRVFWGKGGVPRLIRAPQQACNAAARSILMNMAIASGPQVERNIDRIAPGEDKNIRPWKVWDTTNKQMLEAPAMKFYNVPMVVNELMGAYNFFSKIADEHSGMPSFAHGDTSVGGAGDTASGLSMLMAGAGRGVKRVIKALDDGVISSSVEKMYYLILPTLKNEDIPDMRVVAKGSSTLIAKEQLAIRKKEFMVATNNPTDFGIMQLEGRKYLLEENAKSLEMDNSRLFPKNMPAPAPMPPLAVPAQPAAATTTTDAAGNPSQGMDNATRQGENQ